VTKGLTHFELLFIEVSLRDILIPRLLNEMASYDVARNACLGAIDYCPPRHRHVSKTLAFRVTCMLRRGEQYMPGPYRGYDPHNHQRPVGPDTYPHVIQWIVNTTVLM